MSTYNYLFLKPLFLDKFTTTTCMVEKWQFENLKIFYSKNKIDIYQEFDKKIKIIDNSSYFKYIVKIKIDDINDIHNFFINKFKLKFIKKYKIYNIFEKNKFIGKVFEFGEIKKYYHFETEEYVNFQYFKNKIY